VVQNPLRPLKGEQAKTGAEIEARIEAEIEAEIVFWSEKLLSLIHEKNTTCSYYGFFFIGHQRMFHQQDLS
jgi:hypothetical protein